MDLDDDMIPYSASGDSSPSSSDLDTESTGSFFPDRSTTLGTLMGVSTFGGAGVQRRLTRAAPGQESERPARAATEERDGRRAGGWRRRRRRRGGSWWRLCRDDASGPPTRLGEFLDMERQHAGADFLCAGGPQEPKAPSVAASVRGREGAPAAAARRPAGGAREVAAAAGHGRLVHVLVAGQAPSAAHQHLQRRRGVGRGKTSQLTPSRGAFTPCT